MAAPQVKTSEYFYSEVKSSKGGRHIVNFLQIIAIILVIGVILYLVILIPNQVDGQSMEPNFHDKQLLFTDKTINWLGPLIPALNYNYGRGDVVVFPEGERDLIKRVVGMPGDRLRIEKDRVYINDLLLDEAYIPDAMPTRTILGWGSINEGETVEVPADSYFLMGDNRTNSKDSRFRDIGFVERKELKGRVFFRYWPLDSFGIIGRGESQMVNQ